MEQTDRGEVLTEANWLDKRCRSLVLGVFSKLSYGQLEVVEDANHARFPENVAEDTIQGKLYLHDPSVFRDFVKGGSIGAAEAFIEGKWSSPNLTQVIRIFAKAQQQTDSL
jgi:cyclopropane-fatty-acyl-phospholipid synthase